jgi:hypothetical protein
MKSLGLGLRVCERLRSVYFVDNRRSYKLAMEDHTDDLVPSKT